MNAYEIINGLDSNNLHRIVPILGEKIAKQFVEALERRLKQSKRIRTLEDLEEILSETEETPQEIPPLMDSLLRWAEERSARKVAKGKQERPMELQRAIELKTSYLPTSMFKWEMGPNGPRYRFDRRIGGKGLMQAVADRTAGKELDPVAIPLNIKAEFELPQVEELAQHGMVTIDRTWIWNRKSPAWNLLLRTFPNAIDMSAYIGSLNSPTVPGGIHFNCKVILGTVKGSKGGPAGSDGSGRIHPKHHVMEQLNLREPSPIQIRGINENGVFIKGILCPDEGALDSEGNPAIICDWSQIKAKHKKLAAQRKAEGTTSEMKIHLGIIQVWDKPGSIEWCFENLENINQTEKNEKILEARIDAAFKRMLREGPIGLLRQVGWQNANVRSLLQVITFLGKSGVEINPLSLPWAREIMESQLGKKLWWIAQGAGLKGQRFVVCIDNDLEPGTCVARGFKPGETLAVFRFPIVLAQSLATVEVVKPSPAHTIDETTVSVIDTYEEVYNDATGEWERT